MNDRVPRELLFGNPEKASPKLSPNGKLWAYLAPEEGVLNVWVGPEGAAAKPLTKDRGRGIRLKPLLAFPDALLCFQLSMRQLAASHQHFQKRNYDCPGSLR